MSSAAAKTIKHYFETIVRENLPFRCPFKVESEDFLMPDGFVRHGIDDDDWLASYKVTVTIARTWGGKWTNTDKARSECARLVCHLLFSKNIFVILSTQLGEESELEKS